MAREPGAQQSCPLQCRLRRRAATSDEATSDQVDWAGLPVNLDLVFSQQQRDKVYVQHLRRRRGTHLWRSAHNGGTFCACEYAEDAGRRIGEPTESLSSH